MIIVKLGGSAITDKSKPYTYIRGRVVKIASALRKHAAVYIHGAGSFGHPQVKAFGLTPIGISYIKAALRRLTAYVVEELIEAGVSAMPIEPSEVFWGRALARPEVVLHAVRYGLSPVLHGDVVPYEDGYVVVSGDEVAIELTKVLKPQAVVFLMDVDGVYTKPPGAPGAEKLREIPPGFILDGASGVDVTGGLRKKIEAAFEISTLGAEVYFCSIHDIDAVKSIAEGVPPESCTKVKTSV
ncbi:MAG: isopentenyl phosphate kinase [Pyrobaculum sp.]